MINRTEFTIGQSAHKDEGREGYYKWEVWIENGESDIDAIDYVEYLLHHTYKNRLRIAKSVSDNFKIKSSGWGEFSIGVSIFLKSGEQLQTTHWLTLGDAYHTAPTKEAGGSGPKSVYLSFADADAKEAQHISKMLTDLGMQVASTIDVDTDMELKEFIVSSIAASDAVITLNYNQNNNWQKAEVTLANDLSKSVISLEEILGEDAKQEKRALKKEGQDPSYEDELKKLGVRFRNLKF